MIKRLGDEESDGAEEEVDQEAAEDSCSGWLGYVGAVRLICRQSKIYIQVGWVVLV